ncbi:hypothetical protein VTJ04DRAFT_7920 [Mycothermus thermophilus]|uniref:uncharacterized protein n=1 Tax=Humicola insolens TaxID=85995 RepID=UPI003743D468
MRLSPFAFKRALLPAALFALGVMAQDDDKEEPKPQPTTTQQNNNPQPTTQRQQPTTTQNNPPPPPQQTTTQRNNQPPPTTEEPPKPTEEPKDDDKDKDKEDSKEPEKPEETTQTNRDPVTLTGLPGLGTSTSSVAVGTLTGMPTLSRAPPTGTYSYPPPTIPPTRDAPFMNHSTLPDGTVFIAVGAILGAFGLAVLLWRAILACMLHRSIKNAALAQHASNNGRSGKSGKSPKDPSSFPAPPAQFYKYVEQDSSASLGGGVGTTGRRSHRGPTPSATPSQTNLFFSPTAAGPSSGLGPANRDSGRFLPSGFYASSATSPTHHTHGNSISMSTLRPSSRGRVGPSPPASPDIGPRVVSRNYSSTSLNLNQPPQSAGTRAPSAYLDDLLDEQPGLFPPAGGPASPQGHGSHRGRY